MDDMSALERQLANVVRGSMRPSRAVDATAIVRSVTESAPSDRWSVIARRWQGRLRSLPEGSYSMFSAVKIVAAGVIVALFGGFLLSGVLTTPTLDEAPAALTEAPSPRTTDEVLSGWVAEEVEPGVVRIVNDGLRDLARAEPAGDVISGQDGSVWFAYDSLRMLGAEAMLLPPVIDAEGFWGVRIDGRGTPWLSVDSNLYSHDGVDWRLRLARADVTDVVGFRVQADGTPWVLAATDLPGRYRFYRFDGDKWTRLPKPPAPADNPDLQVRSWEIADDGTLWMARKRAVSRFDGRRWKTVANLPKNADNSLAIAPDGTVRTYLRDDIRTLGADGSWKSQSIPLLPATEDSWPWGATASVLARDGSWWRSVESIQRCGIMCAQLVACGGVARFDGDRWRHYLQDRCVYDIEPDVRGNAWVWAAQPEPGVPLTLEDGTVVETVVPGTTELYLVRPDEA